MIRPAIPGHTPGAGKCLRCERAASGVESQVVYDGNGDQVGVWRRFYCDEHKPVLAIDDKV